MKNLAILSLLAVVPAFAGYDITIPARELSLKTKDGKIIKNAQFDLSVQYEHKEIPCSGDFGPTGFSCWKLRSLKDVSINTGDAGTVTIPKLHFHSDSRRDRQLDGNSLLLALWGVYTPFTATNGKRYNCIAIQPAMLQESHVEFDFDKFIIDLTRDELQGYLDKYVERCRKNIDSGRYENAPYVLPY